MGPRRSVTGRCGASPGERRTASGARCDDSNFELADLVAIQARWEDAVGSDTMESRMSKPGLDNRHRNKDGEISHKHGNTLIRTLRKIYGPGFAAGYPDTEKLSEVLLQLNETSLSQLRRDHDTGHLEHKIANASK
jgi:hypothetical protein